MVIEPLVQGAAGMIVHPPGYLRARARALRPLRRAADLRRGRDRLRPHRHDVRLRAGGRRARPAVPRQGPHRRLPAAGRDARDRARSTRASSARPRSTRTFFHGHTYTGNPLACAAALATLDVFEHERDARAPAAEDRAARRAARRGRGDARGRRGPRRAASWSASSSASTTRRCASATRSTLAARRRGAIIRPLGDMVVLMPPLAISKAELQRAGGDHGESIEAAPPRTIFRSAPPSRELGGEVAAPAAAEVREAA